MQAAEETFVTPVYLLSGFLGSGKTTLLSKLIDYWQQAGMKPAVVMNELGEVNLDGLLVKQEVPMEEMLGGCICCSSRGDLGYTLASLIQKEHPDVIVVEATGAANPMEVLDAVTETALYMKLEIMPVITVVDSAYLMELFESQQGKTYRLMQEQIRCASVLIMNKTDLLKAGQEQQLLELLNKSNPYARKIPAVKCEVDLAALLGNSETAADTQTAPHNHNTDHEQERGESQTTADEEHPGHPGHADHAAHAIHAPHAPHAPHAAHSHVMVYTHYLSSPVDSQEFEDFIAGLPRDVYRAKGVLSFSDTSSRFLFQYAYREPDFMKITPQGDIPDVVVFIGEHFNKEELTCKLRRLEEKTELSREK
ncbi:CobW family GTP-binding protein [Paenibacillus pinistramenti]|uniref:CobW family GTP-binding protein n=1 Tax=Paenibacillus pinistramenti TaxID=1768003 RepID=UPI001EF0F457|nr:GTP-binding protein [Paenibacillus pinistramenti]